MIFAIINEPSGMQRRVCCQLNRALSPISSTGPYVLRRCGRKKAQTSLTQVPDTLTLDLEPPSPSCDTRV